MLFHHSHSSTGAKEKLLSAALALSLVASMFPAFATPASASATENEGTQTASLSQFESGVAYPGRQRSQAEIEELQRAGGVVDLFDASDINYKNSVKAMRASNAKSNNASAGNAGATNAGGVNQDSAASLSAETESLPEKVDMRNTNKVTPVKSQGHTNTCWAWGAAAVAETSIANSTGQAATNYSPFQMAYFGFTPLSSNTSELKGTETSQAGEGLNLASQDRSNLLSIYGAAAQAAMLMMQGCAPTTENLIPFPTQSLQDGKFYEEDSLTPEQRRQNIARLSKWNNLGSLITTQTEEGQTTYAGIDEAVLLNMKKTLASGNAVLLGYFGDTNIDPAADVYLNHATNAQYTYELKTMNHYVSVVGYDDNYSKDNFIEGHKPPANGAFIVKNSWGTVWGDAGYFYLSYYDQSIATTSTFEFDAREYNEGQTEGEEIVDQYDYLQEGYYFSNIYDLADLPNNQAWYSNIYTASQKQQLHHIGTYAIKGMNTLGYKVYKLQSNATSPKDVEGSIDSPFAAGEINVDNEGYVSVELDKTLNLNQGEKYAVWFYQTAGNHVFHIPQVMWLENMGDYVTSAVVNEQESFCSINPTDSWDAMTSNVFSNTINNMHVDGVQDNYCVKGYSTSAEGLCFVGFNSNGGTSVDSQFVESGEKLAAPEAPTKQGATFAGWYKDAELTQAFDPAVDAVESDLTLYAKWTPDAVPGGDTDESGNSDGLNAGSDDANNTNATPTLAAYKNASNSNLASSSTTASAGDSTNAAMLVLFVVMSLTSAAGVAIVLAKIRGK